MQQKRKDDGLIKMKRTGILVLTACTVLLCGCNARKDGDDIQQTDATDATSVTTAITDETAPPQQTIASVEVIGPATVSFLNENGRLIEKTKYGEGEKVEFPKPVEIAPDSVFVRWRETGGVEQEENALAFSPVFESLDGMENVVAYDSVYVGSKEQSFSVPLRLCGKVNAGVLELKASYDTEILDFDSFLSMDGDVLCSCDEKSGTILLSLTSDKNITAAVDLCNISFTVKKRQNTSLSAVVTDIAAVGTGEDVFTDVPFKVVHGNIFFS